MGRNGRDTRIGGFGNYSCHPVEFRSLFAIRRSTRFDIPRPVRLDRFYAAPKRNSRHTTDPLSHPGSGRSRDEAIDAFRKCPVRLRGARPNGKISRRSEPDDSKPGGSRRHSFAGTKLFPARFLSTVFVTTARRENRCGDSFVPHAHESRRVESTFSPKKFCTCQ